MCMTKEQINALRERAVWKKLSSELRPSGLGRNFLQRECTMDGIPSSEVC